VRTGVGVWERVSGNGPVVVIAEAGVNHDGSLRDAHALIDTAAACGADAVKFQTFSPERLVSETAQTAAYQASRTGNERQADMIASLALPDSSWSELREHAGEVGLEFLSTPFDLESAHLLLSVGMRIIKVPSGEITNLPFLNELAGLGRPLLISTGMADVYEVQAACRATATAPGRALMHCVSAYPASNESCNLRALTTLGMTFGLPIGWSDHSTGTESAIAAVALGARVVEKHITLDRLRRGPDHQASEDPAGFRQYVDAIRRTEGLLGDGIKRPHPSEYDVMAVARRSWHACHDLPRGHMLECADLVALRPGHGVPPSADITGRMLTRSVQAGSVILASDVGG
jgi:N,N'-diacetyllegionaminate synthase